jgi:hypothetical protein
MREESLKKRELVQYYFGMALLKQNAIYIYSRSFQNILVLPFHPTWL